MCKSFPHKNNFTCKSPSLSLMSNDGDTRGSTSSPGHIPNNRLPLCSILYSYKYVIAIKISFLITHPLEVKRFSDTHEMIVLFCFVPVPGNSTPCKTNNARLSRGKDLIGTRSFSLEWTCIHNMYLHQ